MEGIELSLTKMRDPCVIQRMHHLYIHQQVLPILLQKQGHFSSHRGFCVDFLTEGLLHRQVHFEVLLSFHPVLQKKK